MLSGSRVKFQIAYRFLTGSLSSSLSSFDLPTSADSKSLIVNHIACDDPVFLLGDSKRITTGIE